MTDIPKKTMIIKRIEKRPFVIVDEPLKPAYQMSHMDWTIDNKDRRRILFVRLQSGILTVLKKKNIMGSTKMVSFLKNTFDIDTGKPAFRSKNTFYYLVDIQKGQLWFESSEPPISPSIIHKVLKESTVSQLVSGLDTRGMMGSILYLIIGIAIGALGGYIIGNLAPMG